MTPDTLAVIRQKPQSGWVTFHYLSVERIRGFLKGEHVSDGPINSEVAPSGNGCVECLAAGGWWLHLRRCAKCGHIGCCDTSPSQHASQHARETDHVVIRSFEPGEDWFWDFATNTYSDGPELAPPLHHPLGQPVPGPAGMVPPDWQDHLH